MELLEPSEELNDTYIGFALTWWTPSGQSQSFNFSRSLYVEIPPRSESRNFFGFIELGKSFQRYGQNFSVCFFLTIFQVPQNQFSNEYFDTLAASAPKSSPAILKSSIVLLLIRAFLIMVLNQFSRFCFIVVFPGSNFLFPSWIIIHLHRLEGSLHSWNSGGFWYMEHGAPFKYSD